MKTASTVFWIIALLAFMSYLFLPQLIDSSSFAYFKTIQIALLVIGASSVIISNVYKWKHWNKKRQKP